MICKQCKKEFHHCSSCGYDPDADYSCCSSKCKEQYYNWPEFLSFYYRLYNFAATCKERQILDENKYELWNTWCDNYGKTI